MRGLGARGCRGLVVGSDVTNARRGVVSCATPTPAPPEGGVRRVAVVGGGLAGLSTAWHLLRAPSGADVDLYDAAGVGSGASSVAAGLLHPLNTQGNPAWRGRDAVASALCMFRDVQDAREPPFYRRTGLRKEVKKKGVLAGYVEEDEAYAVDSARYLQAVASACTRIGLRLERRQVESLVDLQDYDAIVVAAGAAFGTVAEFRGALPLRCKRTWTVDCVPGASMDSVSGNASAPSLLGSGYAVRHGDRWSLGAVHEDHPGGQDALRATSEPASDDGVRAEAILAKAAAAWPAEMAALACAPIRLQSGVRALPPNVSEGRLPLLGRADHVDVAWKRADPSRSSAPVVWVFVGLGARGLLYHSLLGEATARAVLTGSEDAIPHELLRWKRIMLR